jgi:AcrR family transcriptional regulator
MRRKDATRAALLDAAWELFSSRGFDRVTVAEVARAAGVTEKTAFNHFGSKEDLFFSRLEAFGEGLLAAVRERPGLAAVREYLLGRQGLFLRFDAEAQERLRTVNRVIAASPALQARERRFREETADALAELLGGDVEARVRAAAAMGIHRLLVEHVRERVLVGGDLAALPDEVRALGERAFAVLD